MISDGLVAGSLILCRIAPGGSGGGINDRSDQISIVIVMLTLHDRCQTLQAHARVDGWLRQRLAGAILELLKLHEDKVPDLNEPVAIIVRTAGRAAGHMVAMVIKYFRTGSARTGIAHRPEIVRCTNADDAAFRQAGNLAPQFEGLVVVGIDSSNQAVSRQVEVFGDEGPGQFDCDILEVVAKRKITQHLEKGVMPGSVANIFKVIVLAAGAYAFLRRHDSAVITLLDTSQDVFELHHSSVDKHQRRIIARHQRARRNMRVTVALKKVDKCRADIVTCGHVDNLWLSSRQKKANCLLAVRPIAA